MLHLLLSLTAAADESAPSVRHLDGGGVLIRLGGQVVPAASAAAPALSLPNTHRTVSLDFQEADIHSVLRLFAEVSGMNFVASDDVQGTVTVALTDVPWDQALAVILHSKGLGAQVYGERILSIEPIGAP
jgi:type II secretory pathway component GspD/PulD (secretin)